MAAFADIMYMVLDGADDSSASEIILGTTDLPSAIAEYNVNPTERSVYRETLSAGTRELLVICGTCGSVAGSS